MRITLFCEGHTETGLKDLLREAVNSTLPQSCGFRVKSHNGVSDLLSGLDRKIDVEKKNGATVVYILVDLYNYPNIDAHGKSISERVKWITENVLPHREMYELSVKIFVVVHEIETWILADSNVIKKRLKSYQPETYYNLEENGRYSEPAKFLNNLFKTYHPKKFGYEKCSDGVFLLQNADWKKIYESCKVFKSLVDSLREDCKQ